MRRWPPLRLIDGPTFTLLRDEARMPMVRTSGSQDPLFLGLDKNPANKAAETPPTKARLLLHPSEHFWPFKEPRLLAPQQS